MSKDRDTDKRHCRTIDCKDLQRRRHHILTDYVPCNNEDHDVAVRHSREKRKRQRALREHVIARRADHPGEKTERQCVEHDQAIQNRCLFAVEIVVPASHVVGSSVTLIGRAPMIVAVIEVQISSRAGEVIANRFGSRTICFSTFLARMAFEISIG